MRHQDLGQNRVAVNHVYTNRMCTTICTQQQTSHFGLNYRMIQVDMHLRTSADDVNTKAI